MRTTRLIVDEMRPADAYAEGYADCLRELEAGSEQRDLRDADRDARKLDEILDRIDALEPTPHLPDRPRLEREDEAISVANGWVPLIGEAA